MLRQRHSTQSINFRRLPLIMRRSSTALERLRNKREYTTVGFQLLPEKFTLTELQEGYEAILGKKLDKRNFRRKMSVLGILKPLREHRRGGQPSATLSFYRNSL